MSSFSRRDFMKAAVGGVFAAGLLGSRNADAVFMGPEQKREELLLFHESLLSQPVHNHRESAVDKKGKSFIQVDLEPYNYSKNDSKIRMDYYPVKGVGPHAPLIILPMLGGISFIERGLARYYAKHGFPSLIVSTPKKDRDAITDALATVRSEADVPHLADTFNEVYRKGILGVMRVIDWIGDRSELDEERIGALGISLGAIQLASVMGVYGKQKYIKAGVCMLGGAGMHHIISHSQEPGILRDRIALLEAIGRDEAWLEERLYGEFPWDSLHHAHNIDPESIMLFIARGDTYVPTQSGKDLAAAIGNPRVEMVGSWTRFLPLIDGHLAAFFKKGQIQRQALGFFQERLYT